MTTEPNVIPIQVPPPRTVGHIHAGPEVADADLAESHVNTG